MDRQQLADEIKTLRDQRSWSQALLAEHAGLSLRTVQRLEKEGACSQETLLAIAGAFDIDVQKFTRIFTQESMVLTEDYEYRPRWIEFSLPSTLSRLASKLTRMNKRVYKSMASWGLVLLIIPLTFVFVGVFKYSLGFENMFNPFDTLKSIPILYDIITSPIFLLGSLVSAIALNVLPLIDFKLKKEEDKLTGSFAIMGNRWNALIVGASLFFMTLMMGYALIENVSEQGQVDTTQLATNSNNETEVLYVQVENMRNQLVPFSHFYTNAAAGYLNNDISIRTRIINILDAGNTPAPGFRPLQRNEWAKLLNNDIQLLETLTFYEEFITSGFLSSINNVEYFEFDEERAIKNYKELISQLEEVVDEQKGLLETFRYTNASNADAAMLKKQLSTVEHIQYLGELNTQLLDNLLTQLGLQQTALESLMMSNRN